MQVFVVFWYLWQEEQCEVRQGSPAEADGTVRVSSGR